MSYSSKRYLTSIIAGIALIAAYTTYARGTKAPAPGDIKAWAFAILIFIGIGIGIQVVVQILFHIALAIGITVKEEAKAGESRGGETAERIVKAEMMEDEWSKMIELRSSRVGSGGMALGIIAALAALAAGNTTVVALHILFGMTAFASIAEGIAGIVYHERGVKS